MLENRKDKGIVSNARQWRQRGRHEGIVDNLLTKVQKPSHGQNWPNPRPAQVHTLQYSYKS